MPATTATSPLLTVEENVRVDSSDRLTELVCGRIVEHPFPSSRHGFVCGQIIHALATFERQGNFGRAVAYSGIITQRNPDTLRGADASIYSFQRLPPDADLDQYPSVPPEIVIEVKDSADSWPDIAEKVAEYLQVGVDVVCVIDPVQRVAVVHATDAPPRILSAEQVLEFPKILPGFQVGVGQLLA